jgi:MFS family permease
VVAGIIFPDLMTSTDSATDSRLKKLVQKITVMRHAPRELWIILVAYILENIAYKLSSGQVLPLWLTHDLGFGDKSKGAMIGVWSALLTLITVMVGSFADAAGIRRTFLIGFVLCIAARTGMMISDTTWVALTFGLLPLAAGLALMTPVMTAAMKRYSNAAQRSLAFALYYALMNLGFAIGDRLFDHFRHVMGEYGKWTLPGLGADLSTYRVLILWSVVFTVPGLLLTWFFLREGVEMTETGVVITPRKNAKAGKNFWETSLNAIRETGAKTFEIFAGLWGQKAFYRFLGFMALVVGVRMVFYHLNYTLPDFAIRELGKGAPLAQVSSMLNSLLILAFVPICGVLTSKISAYRMVTVGSFISSVSVLFLAMPPEWLRPLADGWLGNFICHKWLHVPGAVNPVYIAIFLFTVGLSIGEALWSPRLYEYAASIAPKGQEASYMALSLLPYFFAKFGAGTLSGVLLSDFCPETGPRNPQLMWYLVACMAVITPLGTILLRKYIQVQEVGREPVMSKAEAAVDEEEAER